MNPDQLSPTGDTLLGVVQSVVEKLMEDPSFIEAGLLKKDAERIAATIISNRFMTCFDMYKEDLIEGAKQGKLY